MRIERGSFAGYTEILVCDDVIGMAIRIRRWEGDNALDGERPCMVFRTPGYINVDCVRAFRDLLDEAIRQAEVLEAAPDVREAKEAQPRQANHGS